MTILLKCFKLGRHRLAVQLFPAEKPKSSSSLPALGLNISKMIKAKVNTAKTTPDTKASTSPGAEGSELSSMQPVLLCSC